MEHSRVLLEMFERIKVLENEVAVLREEMNELRAPAAVREPDLSKVSAKYRNLAEYLLASGQERVSLSYVQLEEILGFSLPDTARNFKNAFWANTYTHSYASSWLALGYKAKVDPDSDVVTFIKNPV